MDRRDFLRSASIAGVYALGSRVSSAVYSGPDSAAAQTIRIRTDVEQGKLPHIWEECVGSDRAVVGLRQQWLSDLEVVAKATGMKSVRFHGLFNDEMGVFPWGAKQPNFLYVDMVFDAMMDRGLKPLVELSFMPGALASGTRPIVRLLNMPQSAADQNSGFRFAGCSVVPRLRLPSPAAG